MTVPRPPAGLLRAGRALWRDLHETFDEFTPQERALLDQCCRVADRIASLNDIVAGEGLMITVANGNKRVHPAAVELRLQQVTQARLFAAMRLPDSDGLRPQHRQARGVYQAKRNAQHLRGVPS